MVERCVAESLCAPLSCDSCEIQEKDRLVESNYDEQL